MVSIIPKGTKIEVVDFNTYDMYYNQPSNFVGELRGKQGIVSREIGLHPAPLGTFCSSNHTYYEGHVTFTDNSGSKGELYLVAAKIKIIYPIKQKMYIYRKEFKDET
ncbi:MAG: hypothetical protein EHM79_18670 [Geobacter sp.]|nr:MAG: hypothetical protein EHM79_18670 [Geobacter sp.]